MTWDDLGRPATVIRADHIPGPGQDNWTYTDYAAVPEDGQRYEVIEGVLYQMPSVNEPHQSTIVNTIAQFGYHIMIPGHGQVYGIPFDVELKSDIVVQPDIMLVLNDNHKIITPSHLVGAPDILVEVIIPATEEHDRTRKVKAYALGGVKEYWLADPDERTIEILSLQNGQYESLGTFRGEQLLPSKVLPKFPVKADLFFYNGSE